MRRRRSGPWPRAPATASHPLRGRQTRPRLPPQPRSQEVAAPYAGNTTFRVFGRRSVGCPLSLKPGTPSPSGSTGAHAAREPEPTPHEASFLANAQAVPRPDDGRHVLGARAKTALVACADQHRGAEVRRGARTGRRLPSVRRACARRWKEDRRRGPQHRPESSRPTGRRLCAPARLAPWQAPPVP